MMSEVQLLPNGSLCKQLWDVNPGGPAYGKHAKSLFWTCAQHYQGLECGENGKDYSKNT